MPVLEQLDENCVLVRPPEGGVLTEIVPAGPLARAEKVTVWNAELVTVKVAVPVVVVTELAGEMVRLVFGEGTNVTVSELVRAVPLEFSSWTVTVAEEPVAVQAGKTLTVERVASGVQAAVPESKRTATV